MNFRSAWPATPRKPAITASSSRAGTIAVITRSSALGHFRSLRQRFECVSIAVMPLMRRVSAWTGRSHRRGHPGAFRHAQLSPGRSLHRRKARAGFSLSPSAGKSEHLSDLKGKVVVLNFWATWCPPCVEETPALNRLQKYIDSRNGMVLGVSVDEDGAAYEKFLKDQAVVFPTYRDTSKKSAAEYGTPCIPKPTSSTATEKSPANSSAPAAMGQPRNAGILRRHPRTKSDQIIF